MTEDRRQRGNVLRRYLGAGAAALVLLTMVYLYYVLPQENIGPQQPIYFSHRIHAGVKEINCKFCHPFAERSRNPGLPPMAKCFYCHAHIITKHPQIVMEKKHYESLNPVPWVRVYYVPDHVKFNHRPHLTWGKLDCTACHGQVKTMDRLQTLEFQMQFCINCHKERKANVDCWLACHH